MTVVLVALAAGLGALARFGVHAAVTARLPGQAPWGTFVVNVSGSFALGLLVGVALRLDVSPLTLTVLGTGFLGAYTTFSTWAYEAAFLLERRAWGRAAWHLGGAWALGVAAAAAGLWLGAMLGALLADGVGPRLLGAAVGAA